MRFYEDNREMNVLWNTERGLIDDLNKDIKQASHNQYVVTMDEDTVSKWEVILGIVKGIDDSLELRRVRIGSRLINRSPVNPGLLVERIDFLLGKSNSKVEFAYKDSIVFITLFRGINESLFYEFELLLRRTIPANMYYKIDMDYDLEASLNLANFKSGTIELEVTDQYEGYFESTGGIFGSGGSVASVTFTEFTDQYHTNVALDGTAQSGTGYIHTTLYEVTDQNNVLITGSGESYTVSTAEFIQEILID